jgi:predicted CXXCH cytochrome family protein
MKGRQVPTDQFQLYATSVHGKALLEKNDLAAPACNDCHGNHAATPPGIQSISKVCGTCHALNDELFSGSAHKKAFDELGLPECETCHGNHDIVTATSELLGAEDTAICSRCHAEDQNPRGFAFARDIRFLVDSLDEAYGYADTLVRDARQKGMEIGEAEFRLREARQARLEARTVIHSFNEERTQAVLSKGLATTSLVAGEAQKAIDEYYFRRTGLGVSTIIITILAVSLYLFIRRLERSQERSPSRPTTANNHH